MIRVTIRQFRAEAVVVVGVLLVLAIVLVVSGVNLVNVNDAFQSTCKAAGNCATATNPVVNADKPLQSALQIIVAIAPALVGLFLGAPLIARELETGTFRIAWTQSVTRKRWLAVKLGVVGVVAMAFGGLLTWMVYWWASPIDAANQNRFGLASFGLHGVAPIGYAAFAFALGATAGVLLRRTIAAMAVTGVGFAAARLAVTYWVRPNLASPVHESLKLNASSAIPSFGFGSGNGNGVVLTPPHVTIPNAWVYATAVVDKAGHGPTSHIIGQACPAIGQFSKELGASGGRPVAAGPGPAQMQACIGKLSATYHTVLTYQPASRFWPFQWAEMGIFLAAALALCGLTYWWLRRRYA
ncbi:MAG: ABC transporter permease subunit [Acidimicrobiales bacterium]